MRLIDADALKGKESYIMMTTLDTCFGSAKIFLTETIDNAPTVDAVPVVRCGDCSDIIRISGKKKNELPKRVFGDMTLEEWTTYGKLADEDKVKEGECHSTQYKYDFANCIKGLKAVAELRAIKALGGGK